MTYRIVVTAVLLLLALAAFLLAPSQPSAPQPAQTQPAAQQAPEPAQKSEDDALKGMKFQ